MRGIKINKIAAIGLIMVVLDALNAQGLTVRRPPFHGGSPPTGIMTDIDLQISIPSMPKVGKPFEVIFTVFCKRDLEGSYFGPEYKISFASDNANIIRGKEQKIYGYLKKGETKQFKAEMVINKPVPSVSISGIIEGGRHGWPPQSIGLVIFLIDELTGQYGTREEYERGLSVEYRYDFMDGSFIGRYDQSRVSLEENRKIIKMMKEIEPALSDSEALLLHSEQYKVGAPKGAAKWDEKSQRWIEDEIYRYYLMDGWLKAVREGRLMEWEEKEKTKIQKEWKGGGGINFFRPDSGGRNNCRSGRLWKTFDGFWKFKDHLYKKDQGLLADAIKKPVKNARARIYITYQINGTPYRYVTNELCVTSDDGYFSITTELPNSFILGKAFAIIFPCGGGANPTSPMISVSDPNPHQPSYKRDPLDPTLYVILNMSHEEFYPNSLPVHFDTVYADTYPAVGQPESGCLNIYETYLHARTFMSPPPSWPLRCLWEPGYSAWTGMDTLILDTVWINGNALIEGGTDEWDDDILLHEFGHYLMDFYAQKPKSDTGSHAWPISYPERPGLAYGEGWADFFSCRTRIGSGTETLVVNTAKGIGGDSVYLWHNMENPWKGEFDSTWFMGGPWCEGAVAGALWDIYDSYNEIPYPSYPWPGFPDTALADTLSMGFAPIWDVFDHYNPPGEPTNCWTIFHFRSGWNSFNYGHPFALNQILLHHRIRDSIPAKPTGLSASQQGNGVRLYWRKNSESDLQGYRIYRRSKPEFTIPPSPWGSWGLLVDKTNPNDTTHLDQTVQSRYRYRYRVTAYDSVGNESDYSDSVEIYVAPGTNPDNIGTLALNFSTIMKKDDIIKIYFNSLGNRKVAIKLYDVCGRLVQRENFVTKKIGDNEFTFRLDWLPCGIYFVHLEAEDYNKFEKIVIVR